MTSKMEELSCYKCFDLEQKLRKYERQLGIVTQEKDLAVQMFQASTQRIDHLEQELNCNEDRKKFELFKRQIKEIHIQMQNDYSDAIRILENKLATVSSDLEIEAKKVTDKEKELEALQNQIEELRIAKDSLLELQKREQCLREKCFSLEKKCYEYENVLQSVKPSQVLDEEIERLRKQLSLVERQRNELQTTLEDTQKTVERLAAEELEARHKVSEAIALVESTLVEKQQTHSQMLLAENECRRLQKELMDLIEEAGRKVKREVELAKRNFQEQLSTAQSQMCFLEAEKNKKTLLIEKQQSEITKLEKELEELKRRSVSPRKLQVLTEQLNTAEAQVELLQTENKSLNEIVMQNQHRYETEISKCAIERRFLEKQILKLQTNLSETGHNLERAVEHCHQLSDHLNKLSSEIVSERVTNEADNSELIKQLQVTKIQSNSAMEELKKYVNAHNNITTKWKDEYSHMTSKFNDRMKELKSENKKEKKRNRKLLKRLASAVAQKETSLNDDHLTEDVHDGTQYYEENAGLYDKTVLMS